MDYVWFGLGILVLPGLTVCFGLWAGVGIGLFPVVAIARAIIQLSIIALLLRGILAAPWTVVAFLALMVTTASWTAAGRLHELRHGRRIAVAGVLAGAALALVVIFALRLVELEVRYLVAVAGIVIGNSMSAATLAGRNFLRASRERRGEIEAFFALGASPQLAHEDIGREAVREALLPHLDQTKSTGLVTLPGAFVGALFGGASPVEAAQFQLVVLAGIGLAMMTTGIVVTRLASRAPYAPATSGPPG
ncbi:MAG: ABC transporter permease [Actinomycetota bacterium]|nr:ABC transporter permease [Actinomycetota bacterium]